MNATNVTNCKMETKYITYIHWCMGPVYFGGHTDFLPILPECPPALKISLNARDGGTRTLFLPACLKVDIILFWYWGRGTRAPTSYIEKDISIKRRKKFGLNLPKFCLNLVYLFFFFFMITYIHVCTMQKQFIRKDWRITMLMSWTMAYQSFQSVPSTL